MEKAHEKIHQICRHIVKHKLKWIFISLLTFIIFTCGVLYIQANFSVKIWLHKHDKRILSLIQHEKTFGSSDTIDIIVYDEKGVFTPQTMKVVSELTEKMLHVDHIARVESITNFNWVSSTGDDINITPFIKEEMINDSDLLLEKKEQAINDRQLINNFISKSGKLTYIRSFLIASDKTPPYKKIVHDVEDIIASYQNDHLHLSLSGISFINESLNRASDHDMKTVLPIVLSVILIILFYFFRNLFAITVPFAIIILSTGVSFGFEGFLDYEFNNILSAIPAILIAVGLADSIHILIGYRHNVVYEHMTNEEAAIKTLSKNMIPTILTTVTTAIGFLSLATTDIRPVHDLGILAGIGCLYAWFFTYFFLGPVLTFINFKKRDGDQDESSILQGVFHFSVKYRKTIIILFPILGIIFGYIGSKNYINADPVDYFSKNSTVRKTFKIVESEFGASRAIELVFDSNKDNGIKEADFLKRSAQFIEWIESLDYVVRVNSYVDVIKKMNKTLHSDDQGYFRIPDTNGEIADQHFLYTLGLPEGADLKNQVSVDQSKFRVMVLWHVNDTMNAVKKSEEILKKAKEYNLNVYEGGQSPIYNRVNDLVVDTFFTSISLTLPIIFLIMIVTFKDFKIALLSLIPNIFPLAIASGIMTLMGDFVNIGNVIVFAVCLGIAVDDTIHFIANYKLKIIAGMDSFDALDQTFVQTGKALVLTTVLLFFGFGLFVLGDFVPNQKFGVYCAIILFFALIADIVLLPAILLTINPSKKQKNTN